MIVLVLIGIVMVFLSFNADALETVWRGSGWWRYVTRHVIPQTMLIGGYMTIGLGVILYIIPLVNRWLFYW